MTNTKVDLMYRDGCNYKAYGRVIFCGPFDAALRARLTAALYRGEQLVTEQVGLSHPATTDDRFATSDRFPDQEDDHGYTEVNDVTETEQDADDDRTFADFVAECEAVAADGWDPMIAIDEAGGWTDPEVAYKLRGGEDDSDDYDDEDLERDDQEKVQS